MPSAVWKTITGNHPEQTLLAKVHDLGGHFDTFAAESIGDASVFMAPPERDRQSCQDERSG